MSQADNFNTINQYIPGQFPSVYRNNGPNLIAFVKAYYEWMEQTNNVIWYTRNFQNLHDIDESLDSFITHFKNEYMANLPANIVANQRLLIKHITDLYGAKGSKRGYELLFRILFNEDIDVYLPATNIFKLSDNQWGQQGYIEVTDNPFLANLIGTAIYSSTTGATALVEDHNLININGKLINVLHISNINGNFKYGEQILSSEVPAITGNNAPFVRGSLSSVSIENGGVFFNVGDIVNISGSGAGALGRVSSVSFERGKVIFDLVDGGFGYTMNPDITVSGGGGTGATFSVGAITDQMIYSVNTDELSGYYNVVLDDQPGFNLTLANVNGTFTIGETVHSTANGVGIDFAYLEDNTLILRESLSNTSLGIANLYVVQIDNPNFLNVTGSESDLNNGNLVPGTVLISNLTDTVIYVNSVYAKVVYAANGKLTTINGSTYTVANATGYFLPSSLLIGSTSGANGIVNTTVRNTNWNFPVPYPTNFDTPIDNVLTYEDLTIGSISRLIKENPGEDYTSNATVNIFEPLIYQLQIPDGHGGVWGGDANITATALAANGIMTSVQIMDSGYGFIPGERVSLYSNNNYAATGHAVVDGVGLAAGSWQSRKSFVSDQNYLQDSYYYQPFSYEIIAPRAIATYEKFVRDVVHPVGYQLFGRLRINDVQNSVSNIQSNLFKQYNGNTLVAYIYS